MTAALLLAVLLGGVAQRATGMGLTLVSAPFIVVALGPAAGVVIGNLLGVVAGLLVLTRVWRFVEWRMLRPMVPAAIAGVLAGTLLAEALPSAWAQVLIGAIVLLGLSVSSVVARIRHVARSTTVMTVTSAASGATAALAGIGGPAMAVLRTLTRWEHQTFTATLQPFFFAVSTVTVAVRVGANPTAWPDLGWGWAAIGLAMAVGVALGDVVARRLSPRVVAASITAIAALGAVWTLVDGLTAL